MSSETKTNSKKEAKRLANEIKSKDLVKKAKEKSKKYQEKKQESIRYWKMMLALGNRSTRREAFSILRRMRVISKEKTFHGYQEQRRGFTEVEE